MGSIAVIDYGSGNLHSALKSLQRAAVESGCDDRIALVSDVAGVRDADRLVLPGVGAFGDCRSGLERAGLVDAIQARAVRDGVPFLGICVGMQLMAERGEEHGGADGFGWMKGLVQAIRPDEPTLKIPHMGWNTLNVRRGHDLLRGIRTGDDGWHAYFVHSFHFVADDPEVVVATTPYGGAQTAMIARDNLAGVQFHPEKSQALGLRLLANFLSWSPS